MLESEVRIMTKLQTCKRIFHIDTPKLLYSGTRPLVIVMEKVGSTLLDLMPAMAAMSLKTVCMIGLQTISALQEIHECGVVHRDIKPDNIAVSLDSTSPELYFIDLGLSTEILINHTHVNYSENCAFQGTPYFCSENALRGIRVTRRDDVESLGYVLLFLHVGVLPWMGVKFGSREDVVEMLEVRSQISLKKLCKDAHPIFESYLSYCKSLSFAEKPDYSRLRSLFQSLLDHLPLDWQYDWLKPRPPPTAVARQRRGSLHSNSLQKNLQGLALDGVPSPGVKIQELRRRSLIDISTDVSEELFEELPKTPLRGTVLDGTRLRRFSQCYKLRGSEESQG